MSFELSRLALVIGCLGFGLVGCGGGSNSPTLGTAPAPASPATPRGCEGSCATASSFLTVADVQQVIARGVAEAKARNAQATIAVVDRVGNVLAVYRMRDARSTVLIGAGNAVGGLEGVNAPSELAAISKAVTGAFLSSEGNAFSTRTASQIVQEHFLPREFGAPSGPLYGVQFSQLLCSDFINLPAPVLSILGVTGNTSIGPKPAPLGLSADPGGFPLYKAGTPIGGVGVAADPRYTLDPDIFDRDNDLDEAIALAATFDFGAPTDRRGDSITVDGRTFRYSDLEYSDLRSNPTAAPAFSTLGAGDGALLPVFGFQAGAIIPGTVFGTAPSGLRPDTTEYPGLDAFVFVDAANQPRFSPRSGVGAGAITAVEARTIVSEGLKLAQRMRAQIRQPASTPARVTVTVVDMQGNILAQARTRDAPVFGADVSIQKARTAAFFSSATAAAELAQIRTISLNPNATPNGPARSLQSVVDATRSFFQNPSALANGGIAFTPRSIGNIARPYYPDGIPNTEPGPLSTPINAWSPFAVGLQLDMLTPQLSEILQGFGAQDLGRIAATVTSGCTANSRLKNGIQIFPGGVPIYRGGQLVGAVGTSGDGIDQDDMVSFLGLANASQALGGSIGHAPAAIRSDQLSPRGARLRYVQCPVAPFIDSTQQNVCAGI